MTEVVTRFAPSPTGYLHIGGARTALFNWLFARHSGGRFLLRIEDTDRVRSTDDAVSAIFDSLKWLELDWDGDAVSQFSRAARHAEIVEELLEKGHAYRCYASPEELAEMREQARARGTTRLYDGRWRDRDPSDAPVGIAPVIRFRAPLTGVTTIEDNVQGQVTVKNDALDDIVLLRADGSPTYMLAVVVDDHDMGVTHVIRGDEHLNNALRQVNLIEALGWQRPTYAHIPLIHGADGAKLSKRHGALGVEAYREMGYLPETLRNYLLRLGWGHGDDEIIDTAQAIAWFDLGGIGKSPSRLDFAKLDNLNGHYVREASVERLVVLLAPHLLRLLGRVLSPEEAQRLAAALPDLKERAKTLVELAENSSFYFCDGPPSPDEKAKKLLTADAGLLLARLHQHLLEVATWSNASLEAVLREFAAAEQIKLGQIAQPLRAALTGRAVSPGVFDVMRVLGREETLGRIKAAATTNNPVLGSQ
ncbi:MAG: glutamate--tRNA ligase [Proteobacteria bacterium]|nr:glutamate--tRNA ligase [Pseudomonadota bacterium]MDA1058584.1 glutamate--tRNA ligase [Pseudomonadota bacterium]